MELLRGSADSVVPATPLGVGSGDVRITRMQINIDKHFAKDTPIWPNDEILNGLILEKTRTRHFVFFHLLRGPCSGLTKTPTQDAPALTDRGYPRRENKNEHGRHVLLLGFARGKTKG